MIIKRVYCEETCACLVLKVERKNIVHVYDVFSSTIFVQFVQLGYCLI